VAGLNIGSVLTKDIAKYKDENIEKCARLISLNYIIIFGLTVILAFFLFLFSNNINLIFFSNSNISNDLKIASFILLFAIVFSLNESIYRGLGLFKRLGKLQVISSLSFSIFVPLGAYYNNVTGAVLGYLAYSVIMSLLTVLDLKIIMSNLKLSLFTFKNLKKEYVELKELTLPIFMSSIIEAPVFWFSQVILIEYSGMASNGVANALLQTRNLILIIPGYVSLVILPILSNNLKNKDAYKKNFNQAFFVNLVISVCCTLPLIIFPTFFFKNIW
jgi:O-antigen/teichoic acid export membrane protein